MGRQFSVRSSKPQITNPRKSNRPKVRFKVARYGMFAETDFVPNGRSITAQISGEGVERLYEMAAKPGGNSLNITAYNEAGEVVTICNGGFDINEETVPFLDDMTAIVPKGDGWGSVVECPVTRRY